MRRLLGCLGLLVVLAILLAVAGYVAYRAAYPYVERAAGYVTGFRDLPQLDARIADPSTYTPPASGELDEAQVARFARVQDHIRDGLGARVGELERKHAALRAGQPPPSIADAFTALSDLGGLFFDARRYQVEGLNAERFSQAEYDWVRTRVYAAAGVQAGSFDIRRMEELMRAGQQQVGLPPTADLPEPPARNRALVQPYLAKVKEWLPLAFFGL